MRCCWRALGTRSSVRASTLIRNAPKRSIRSGAASVTATGYTCAANRRIAEATGSDARHLTAATRLALPLQGIFLADIPDVLKCVGLLVPPTLFCLRSVLHAPRSSQAAASNLLKKDVS